MTKYQIIVFSLIFIFHGILGQLCRTPNHKNGYCVEAWRCKSPDPKMLGPEDEKLLVEVCTNSGIPNAACCLPKDVAPLIGSRSLDQQQTAKIPFQLSDKLGTKKSNSRDIELNAEHCGMITNQNKISRGNKTFVGEFPFMVLLSNQGTGNKFNCGGTLISPRYVLTAAHCINGNLVSVRVGENLIDQEQDCEVSKKGKRVCAPPPVDIGIDKMVIHPKYRSEKIPNDIALIRLSKPISLDNKDYVNTICLPSPENSKLQEDTFLIAGWGRTEKVARSDKLSKARISRKPIENCRDDLSIPITPDTPIICAAGENLIDSCRGDSGGPLFWPGFIHSGSRYVQHGITSVGYLYCGELSNGRTLPALYTDVAHHIDWIRKEMY